MAEPRCPRSIEAAFDAMVDDPTFLPLTSWPRDVPMHAAFEPSAESAIVRAGSDGRCESLDYVLALEQRVLALEIALRKAGIVVEAVDL